MILGQLVNRLTMTLFGDPRTLGHARSPHWQTVRKAFLKGKVCACCGGTEDLEAHHIKPFHTHPELELVVSNLLPLCEKPSHSCHLVWGHFYNWAHINSNVVADVAAWLARVEASNK